MKESGSKEVLPLSSGLHTRTVRINSKHVIPDAMYFLTVGLLTPDCLAISLTLIPSSRNSLNTCHTSASRMFPPPPRDTRKGVRVANIHRQFWKLLAGESGKFYSAENGKKQNGVSKSEQIGYLTIYRETIRALDS